ncbi:4-coumarate--CoA ligase-like 7 [Musa acuminata AAA Group]|uniref:4-coumarate--CoA ligase-like 7 n=1 Tax=Musa acuminata AAA Group TaxID=214697 RepID=UPI0031DB17AB
MHRRRIQEFRSLNDVHQTYGSTEAGGISTMIGHEECRRLRSVGSLSQDVEAKIVDTVTGQPLSIGQSGELRIRGPACLIGYVGDEEANGRAFDSSGWLKTGDLCYFDGDWFLFVLDRLKELIKNKAYQVPPAELEHLLQSLPGVADAAVVTYPDAEAGQIPVAFIVRQPGHDLTEARVMGFVAEKVAAYKKKIRGVVFTNSIPKTAYGKILRSQLRNHVETVKWQTTYDTVPCILCHLYGI